MATGNFTLKQVNQAIAQGAWSGYIAPRWVEYLCVAGGGGGGGGGGGAGGLLTGMVPVVAGTSYSVTVGGGGALGTTGATGTNGDNSVFSSINAIGGGGGGGDSSPSDGAGGTGSSGGSGGGGVVWDAGTPGVGGAGISGQGNYGGTSGVSTPGWYNAGGGGGAGTIGLAGTNNNSTLNPQGRGGAGIASSINGTVTVYASGGSGYYNSDNTTGATNTGNGGGGRATSGLGNGFAGGSGIVIVRYPGTVQFFTGGTVNYAGGHIVHTFYSSGTLAPTTPTPYSNTYQISRSLRFNKADGANLSRTVGGSGNRRTFTFSAWIKRSTLNTSNVDTPAILMATDQASGSAYLTFGSYGVSTDTLQFNEQSGSSITITNAVFRDLSAWYHIVLAVDTTQAASTNRVKIYVNGVDQTFTAGSTYPPVNTQTYINYSSFPHKLGTYSGSNDGYQFAGYMAEINFIDGQQLTPSSFGEYDVNTGVWIPRSYGGSYGTNGFKLNFSDNSNTTAATLGADSSGNGNNFTPNNFSVTAGVTNDSFVDTPTPYGTDTGAGGEVRGNYCTLNPLDVAGTPTISEGNLKIVNTNADCVVRGTFGMPGNSGKWYWEFTQQTAIGQQGQSPIVYGMATLQSKVSHTVAVIRKAAYYYTDYLGRYLLIYVNGASAATISVATAIAINEVLQFAYDSDTGKVWIGKSGVWSDSSGGTTGNPATGANATYTFASVDEPMTPTFDHAGVDFTASLNCGQRAFVNTAPSGFKALCTTNLPTPTIGATATTQANKYFNPVTYTGAGGTQAVSVGFQPDFVWMKSRSNGSAGHILQNAVTGVTKGLQSNNTDPEFTDNTTLTEFNSAGFKVGGNSQTNLSADTYVAWNWKANGAGVNNTDGSITSTVSANPTAGFSIVTYASTTGTVGHGLGVAPSVIIMKGRNVTDQWTVGHASLNGGSSPWNYGLALNASSTQDTSSAFWNNTTPTSTVFSQGSWDSGYNKVAYCFAPIAGYSAFGSYAGNNSTDGPFVYTGFRPAFVILKTYTGETQVWIIVDSKRFAYNVVSGELYASTSGAESSGQTRLDFVSNGFKLRTTDSAFNGASPRAYIYMAFAENPFKYSVAR